MRCFFCGTNFDLKALGKNLQKSFACPARVVLRLLIAKADRVLYLAKEQEKNRIVGCDSA